MLPRIALHGRLALPGDSRSYVLRVAYLKSLRLLVLFRRGQLHLPRREAVDYPQPRFRRRLGAVCHARPHAALHVQSRTGIRCAEIPFVAAQFMSTHMKILLNKFLYILYIIFTPPPYCAKPGVGSLLYRMVIFFPEIFKKEERKFIPFYLKRINRIKGQITL
jgi:hypothetical protein